MHDDRFAPVPKFAEDYPNVAETLAQTRLPFYCMNCQHKKPTVYITPNFGPLCKECVKELELALLQGLGS